MPWWSQPVADEDPPAEHVCYPDDRRFGCWTCSCGEVYEPHDVRKQLPPKKQRRALATISDTVRVRGRAVLEREGTLVSAVEGFRELAERRGRKNNADSHR